MNKRFNNIRYIENYHINNNNKRDINKYYIKYNK